MIVEVCCNNPDNGLFDGKATAIRFGNSELCYEAVNWKGVKFTDTGKSIRLHGKVFPYSDMNEWVGNWCWNSYKLDRAVANKLYDAITKSNMWVVGDF